MTKTFEHQFSPEYRRITIANTMAECGRRMTFCLPDGRHIVSIEAQNGLAFLEYADGYQPDPMTQQFWEGLKESHSLMSLRPDPVR